MICGRNKTERRLKANDADFAHPSRSRVRGPDDPLRRIGRKYSQGQNVKRAKNYDVATIRLKTPTPVRGEYEEGERGNRGKCPSRRRKMLEIKLLLKNKNKYRREERIIKRIFDQNVEEHVYEYIYHIFIYFSRLNLNTKRSYLEINAH